LVYLYKNVLSGRHEIYISSWFAFKYFDFLKEKDTPKDTINTTNVSRKIYEYIYAQLPNGYRF